MTSSGAYSEVLARAGARVPVVPALNQEVVNNVKNFTGQVHSNITNYPNITPQSRPAGYDSDYDGMPNTWEQTCGLDPNNEDDGAQFAPNGYTNLENFLNKLAGDTIPINDCGGLGSSTAPTSPYSASDRIQVNTGGPALNVRSCASLSCSIVGTQADRSLGTITNSTPTQADGYTWQQTDYATGADGWSVISNLVFAGDLNRDRAVNSLDWSLMNSAWFTSDTTADINRDGLVNSIDFGILNKNWGRAS
jgi:hypothetical protein